MPRQKRGATAAPDRLRLPATRVEATADRRLPAVPRLAASVRTSAEMEETGIALAQGSQSLPTARIRPVAIRGLSIRATIFLLTAFLGVLLIASTLLHVESVLRDYRVAQSVQESNALRDGLLTSSGLLSSERRATFQLLIGPRDADPAAMSAARVAVDALRSTAEADIRTGVTTTANSDSILALLTEFGQRLELLRGEVDRGLTLDDAAARSVVAQVWFEGTSAIIGAIQSARVALLSREEPVDAELSTLGLLRYYLGIAREGQAQNAILIDAAMRGAAGTWWLDIAQRNAGRIALAWKLVSEQLAGPVAPGIVDALASAVGLYQTAFVPLENSLITALSQGQSVPEGSIDAWREVTRSAYTQQQAAQGTLLAATNERIDQHRAGLIRALIGWIALTLAGLVAVAVSALVLRDRIVRPLDNLRISMLRLANNDLEAPVFQLHRRDEVAAMNDALRVFKANAIRRQRLQVEREQLNTKLRSAYSTLKADLEAAAAVQQAILPTTSKLDGVGIHQLFLASSVVAGDTFNVLRGSKDRLIFFHVDVSGHGAAAALVSMASHHVLTKAAVLVSEGSPLAEVVAGINDEWPENLPYFTMIYGYLDIGVGRGHLVQAGHPPPFIIDASRKVRAIGDGGVPIGLLPGSSFDVSEFSFRTGDRLMLHSDGIIDAMNPREERFSEERLDDLVRRHAADDSEGLLGEIDRAVRSWRGNDELEDDISVVIIESGPDRSTHGHR